jgi:ParB-like chromosome segregation protein Spo0J
MQCSPIRQAELQIIHQDPGQLHPNPRNPRTHPKAQIHQIAASIRQFGFVTPVLIDASSMIVAGHGRVVAAKLLGLTSIPTVQVDHLSPAELRALSSPTTRSP